MNAKAIHFTPEVLKAKLRVLDDQGRIMTRRPMKPQPVEIDADGGGRIWHLETKDGFINSNKDGTWPLTLTHEVRDQDGCVYPPVAPFHTGQQLWVRERALVCALLYPDGGRRIAHVRYEVDGAEASVPWPERLKRPEIGHCIPNGVHREGARHFLEVVEVRAERVVEISEQDARLEGVEGPSEWVCTNFFALYDSIYGVGAHARDWCWVYTLKRKEP